MATESVSGITREELEELREEYEQRIEQSPYTAEQAPDFDEKYCLAHIARQPDDYDGPPRYCSSQDVISAGSAWLCKHHGGATDVDENHSLAEKGYDGSDSMKHGMFATRENLIADFDEKDEALYNWVLREYPNAYDIDLDSDPSTQYDLHRLAVEIVRAERGRGWLIEEGEVNEKNVRDENGRVIVDDNGDIVTEKSEHYLAQMLHRQDKKITQLEKELGITRKEQRRHDQTDDAVDAIKSFANVGADLLAREQEDFDPNDWDETDEAD